MKKLSSSNCTFLGVTITTCLFPHNDKSKELDYVRKSAHEEISGSNPP